MPNGPGPFEAVYFTTPGSPATRGHTAIVFVRTSVATRNDPLGITSTCAGWLEIDDSERFGPALSSSPDSDNVRWAIPLTESGPGDRPTNTWSSHEVIVFGWEPTGSTSVTASAPVVGSTENTVTLPLPAFAASR